MADFADKWQTYFYQADRIISWRSELMIQLENDGQ
jgi:hypothetical protein